jgi:hypothetical protein
MTWWDAEPARWVYVLRRLDPDTLVYVYKIGISRDPHQRAQQCQAELLTVEDGGRWRERELHNQFAHLSHYRGDLEGKTEWFLDDTGEIEDYVAQMAMDQ